MAYIFEAKDAKKTKDEKRSRVDMRKLFTKLRDVHNQLNCCPPVPTPLTAGDGTGPAWIHPRGHAQGSGKGLEACLNNVVGIGTIQLTNVQGQPAVGNRHEELLHQLGVVRADLLAGNCQAVAEVGGDQNNPAPPAPGLHPTVPRNDRSDGCHADHQGHGPAPAPRQSPRPHWCGDHQCGCLPPH